MASEIKLPELGENLESGEVLDIKVAPGDTVREGQTLLEVEAEKSTVEVPAPYAGRIVKLLVKKGDEVRVNQPICQIEAGSTQKNGESAPARPKEESQTSAAEQPITERGPTTESPKEKAAAKPLQKEVDLGDRFEDRVKADHTSPIANKLVPAGPATRRLARELGVD